MRHLSLTLLLAAIPAFADGPPVSGAEFVVEKWTLSAGGGDATGGTFALQASIGQSDAGVPLVGAGYELQSGFWGGASKPRNLLYRDSLEGQ